MISEDEFKRFKEQFEQTNRSKTKKQGMRYNEELFENISAFMQRQYNDTTKYGTLNHDQYTDCLRSAEDALFYEVFLNSFSEDLTEKDPLYVSCKNMLRLMFSRVYNGRDRDLLITEMQTKQPINISRG